MQETQMHRRLIFTSLVLICSTSLVAQEKAKPKPLPARPEPTVANYAYANDHERQKFDVWQAKSDKPTPVVLLIHGGGWTGGDKTGYGKVMMKPLLDEGFSVASINSRFILKATEQRV